MSQTHHPEAGMVLVGAIARGLYARRFELVAFLLVTQEIRSGSHLLGSQLGHLIGLASVAVVLLVPWSRHRVLATLRRSRRARAWGLALRQAGYPAHTYRLPRILRLDQMLTGERLELLLPPGIDASELIRCSDRLAVALQAGRVTVAANPHNAARVQVQVMRRDPLAGPSGIAWPHANRERLSLWEPIPVGLDEKGAVVRISLAERNVLIGGEPGAGKSSALSMLVATAALDPGARLWLLDGKLVELAPWSGCADGSAGVRVDDAVRLLRVVRDEMEARYLDLLKRKRRKVSPEDGLPFHVVVCDELAHYLNSGEKRDRAEFAELLRDLVSRGRAAGVIVLAATQKPASDVVPTSLRDLFGFRWALRCSTPQASDTILGSGWASAGYSATTIDSASRGLGYLLHEGGEPNRMRAFYLNDQQVEALAERAEALRQVTR